MLFTIGNNDYMDDYFNIKHDGNNVLSPKEGLVRGNLFSNEYDEYKGLKPKMISATDKKGNDLLKIRELTFAIIDLNLKLDVEPNNMELYNLFKKYTNELNDLVKEYSAKYEPLELCESNYKEYYTWYKSPWPWEEQNNV